MCDDYSCTCFIPAISAWSFSFLFSPHPIPLPFLSSSSAPTSALHTFDVHFLGFLPFAHWLLQNLMLVLVLCLDIRVAVDLPR